MALKLKQAVENCEGFGMVWDHISNPKFKFYNIYKISKDRL